MKKNKIKEGLFNYHEDYKSSYKVVLGDTNDFLKNEEDNKYQLIITSPPYNVGKEYEVKQSIESYLKTQKVIIAELVRVLRDQGSICWQVGNYISNGSRKAEVFPLDIFYYQIFKELGLQLRNRIIWHFGHGLHAKNRLSGRYETVLWFTKTDDYIFNLDKIRIDQKYKGKRYYKGPNRGKPSSNPDGKNPSDMWEVLNMDWDEMIWNIPNVKSNHPEKTIHPCQFPIELVERCILALTDPGDWILDPYSGVGSTVVAAIKNSRNVVGVDKEEKYTKIAYERINKLFDGSLKLRPIGKKIHVPSPNDKVAQVPLEWLLEKEK